jgi:hypothetical protein
MARHHVTPHFTPWWLSALHLAPAEEVTTSAADALVLCLFKGPSRAAVAQATGLPATPCERLMDTAWPAPLPGGPGPGPGDPPTRPQMTAAANASPAGSRPHDQARQELAGADRAPATTIHPPPRTGKETVMSRLHTIRPLATFVTALALLTLALAITPHGAASAATTAVTYNLATVTVTPGTGSCDIPPCQVITYTFTGTGTTSTAGAPASGTFTWTFTPSKYSNSNACAFTQGTGTLAIIWQDASTTDVSFSFKARDAHTWAIKGQVASGGTNTFYPPTPTTPAEGVVGYPPNPCTGGTVPATISLYPPSPI